MEPGFLSALFAIAAIAIIASAVVSAARREEAAATVATRLGMTHHRRDEPGITRLPHQIPHG